MPCSSNLEKSFLTKKPLLRNDQAIVEAERCLFCYDAPCIKACPTEIDVPRFIRAITESDPLRAASIILEENILGYSCARVCPTEVLCEGACVLNHGNISAIDIGSLQHFATEQALLEPSPTRFFGEKALSTNKRVACIGAGPSSIAVAGLLALKGHEVHIFEKGELLGGINAWGIAPYKLTYDDAMRELNWILTLGVKLHENRWLSSNDEHNSITPAFLLDKFHAIFLGSGLGDDQLYPDLPTHNRIFGALDFISRLKTDSSFSLDGVSSAHVIGGGNTAIDVAHELALLEVPKVALVYRKESHRMSAYSHEIKSALHDQVHIID